jgi:hypothetical protein
MSPSDRCAKFGIPILFAALLNTRETGENGDRYGRRVQTLFIDDLDGGEAGDTVAFRLDGAQYEMT